jgi:1A family penicillin-binding protein
MRKKFRISQHVLLTAFLAILGIGFFAVGMVLIAVAVTPTPDINSFSARQVDQSTKIYDRTGQVLLYDYNRDARRIVVPLADISANARNATIAIEDSSFYEHGGVRFTSIIRAVIKDISGGSLAQGGSTITQQVVKNTLLTNKKSVVRKIHEWVLATKMEKSYSKDQILEAYLNTIPYGGTLYGIEAASEAYFGIPAKDLSIAQSAYLAAMIQAPSYYAPNGAHRAELDARKDLVISRMLKLGLIDDAAYEAAKSEEVVFSSRGKSTIIAPHFVFYVLNQLERMYGANALMSGLTVITTLDAELQTKAEEVVSTAANKNEASGGAKNAALVALDPKTGQILSMVGSRDFFDEAIDGQYNATLALRQPGSAMKPFIYARALMQGYTPNTVVFDVPTQFSTACAPTDTRNNESPCYAPRNYDGKFRGAMTFATALAQSINIPAVKVLYLAGVQPSIDLAKSMGLTTLGDAKQYGLTIVLGGGEVRLLDIVSAYGVFANNGVRNPPVSILEVSDRSGTTLSEFVPAPSQVLSPAIARTMASMLSDEQARIPEYNPGGVLAVPGYEVAAKTGTTDNFRDAWTIGFAPNLAVGVWIGNNDNSPAKSLAGLVAAPMWKQVMAYGLSKYPKEYFGEAEGITSGTHPMLQGVWQIPDANGEAVPHSLLYWFDKSNPRGGPPSNPAGDPQFAAWEYGIRAWYNAYPELFYKNLYIAPLSYTQSDVEETDY